MATPSRSSAAPRVFESEAAVKESPGFFTGLKQLVFGSYQSTSDKLGSHPDVSMELATVAAGAITAWETEDFDTFAVLAHPQITVSLPGASASGMQGVWATRNVEKVDGVLSIDTVMVQVDDAQTEATVVAIEHCHDTARHGMPVKHAWLRMALRREAGSGHGEWRISELLRDPIWPVPTESDAAPEEFRLGRGRTLGACADVTSVSSVAMTAWMAGDRPRFELVVAPHVQIRFSALGIDATDVATAWEARAKMIELGSLIAVNSAMADFHDSGQADMLAHAHLYDVSGGNSSGRPTAHFAIRIKFQKTGGSFIMTELIGDTIWMHQERESSYETEGLSFDSPPLQTVYTCALTFIKAWETYAEEAIDTLVAGSVRLTVPHKSIEHESKQQLLEYRASLGELGMLTVDSVRVVGSRFECYLHEYGVDTTQHGLPIMHAGLKLDFTRVESEMLLSSMYLDIEYTPPYRRTSSFADVGADVMTTKEL